MGYKCEVVMQPPNGLSRGPYSNSNWYIAYADLEYEKDYWNHNSKISETWTRCDNDFLLNFNTLKVNHIISLFENMFLLEKNLPKQ